MPSDKIIITAFQDYVNRIIILREKIGATATGAKINLLTAKKKWINGML